MSEGLITSKVHKVSHGHIFCRPFSSYRLNLCIVVHRQLDRGQRLWCRKIFDF